ncbi:hypothetical protein [Oerskovia paurometabola]|uniref:hypothetical protein n=1 Tax=Oerskovia paurometabola TaxID=162170 RepID=UPI00380F324E
MTTIDPTTNTADLLGMSRRSLANRLHGLARRAEQMDTVAMLEMHRHLDEFRDDARDGFRNRPTETA